MTIKFYCQKCDQRLSVADKKAGKTVSCPACHSQISIPLKSEPRRGETAEEKPKTPPQTQKNSDAKAANQEEDQLLDDLDDLGPLGESWDEILEEDLESAAAAEKVVEPPINEPVDEPEQLTDTPETEEADSSLTSSPEGTQQGNEQETKQEPVSAPTELAESSTVEETKALSPAPTTWEEDDDDEEDEDSFSIRSAESEFEEMDLTPMVDVTFLLLIFFMITASFSLQKSIEVPPPNPDEDGVSQSLQTLDDFREESIIVEIDNNNGIYVDDTKLSNPSEIVQAILDRRDQGGKPKTELVLSAHNAARHETVVAVVDAANEVGMQKIRLASYQGPEE